MSNKKVIEGLEELSILLNYTGQRDFIVHGKSFDADKILPIAIEWGKALDKAGEVLPEKKESGKHHCYAGIDCDLGSQSFNQAIDIAQPILAKKIMECAEKDRELFEIKETYKNIIEEKCAGDELHCTCVPALRKRIKELEKNESTCTYALMDNYNQCQSREIINKLQIELGAEVGFKTKALIRMGELEKSEYQARANYGDLLSDFKQTEKELQSIKSKLTVENVYRKIRLNSLACEVDRISVVVSKIDYNLGRELNLLYKKMIENQNKLAQAIIKEFGVKDE